MFVSTLVFDENVVMINATIKTYAMVGCEKIIREIVKMKQYTLSYLNSIVQYATMKEEYEACRDVLIAEFHEMRISVTRLNGVFYTFSRINVNAFHRIMGVGLITAQGTCSGSACVDHVRVNCTVLKKNIKEAIARMAKVLG
jgi:aspartate/methionine/tyrosine aminotransferase